MALVSERGIPQTRPDEEKQLKFGEGSTLSSSVFPVNSLHLHLAAHVVDYVYINLQT